MRLFLLILVLHGFSIVDQASSSSSFAEAPHFRNGDDCPQRRLSNHTTNKLCNPLDVHVAMTLDARYLRGSIAAIHSILKHSACPHDFFFHFVYALGDDNPAFDRILLAAFPSLRFRLYGFFADRLRHLISRTAREALENPLNYARAYLPDLLPPCVRRVVYLDSDVILVDDLRRLYRLPIPAPAVIAAPEYCHANFQRYFTADFWDSGRGAAVFSGRRRRPCYFNAGVMVIDLKRWLAGGFTRRVEGWMGVQRRRRIYDLGSLPPFLLAFAGEVEPVDHRWNQHGLGGDNEMGRCQDLHPGKVSLMHWSGKGKPWDRLDAGKPCAVDRLWEPYDLFRPAPLLLEISFVVAGDDRAFGGLFIG